MRHTYADEDGVAQVSLMLGDEFSIITHIWTSPAHRGAGRASKLLGLVCRDADSEGVDLLLSVAPDEPGMDHVRLHRWYRSFGFVDWEGCMRRLAQNP